MSTSRKIATVLIVFFSTLMVALAAGLIALLPLFIRLVSHGQWPGLQETAVVLMEGNRLILVRLLLLTVALFSFWFARQLILKSPALWSDNGCPSCQKKTLLRVHRRRRERCISRLTRIPLGRFNCRECSWNGVRLVGSYGAYYPAILKTLSPLNSIKRGSVRETDTGFSAGFSGMLNVSQASVLSTEALENMSDNRKGSVVNFSDIAYSPNVMRGFLEWIQDKCRRPFPVAIFYLTALTIAEVIVVLFNPVAGAIMQLVILYMLLIHAALTWPLPIHRFLLALTLIPLIRLISLSLPLVNFQFSYWFLVTSLPLFGAAFVVMRELNFEWRDVFSIGWRGIPIQLLIGMSGILFGFVEYMILRPEPLIADLSWQQFLISTFILLICTGFLEEFIFRFLIQRTSIEYLGVTAGIVYAGIIFAVLHIGYSSILDLFFVFAVGLFFGWVVYKTHNIIGASLAHGITNILLFLILPFLFVNIPQPFEQTAGDFCNAIGDPPVICETIGIEQSDGDSFKPSNIENSKEQSDRNPGNSAVRGQTEQKSGHEQTSPSNDGSVSDSSVDDTPNNLGFRIVNYEELFSERE